MSLLDGPLGRAAVLDLSSHQRILPSCSRINRSYGFCCNAKISVDDDEQKHESSHKGFSIKVPTIPKLADIESARRMLESAFQSLPFDMPRIPIDSALQGLAFDIFKLPIPKQGLVFDITGFVATKLRKPPKHPGDLAVSNESLYPRCAWPRISKEAHSGRVTSIENPEILQYQEKSANFASEKSASTSLLKANLNSKVELGERSCISSFWTPSEAPVGPHCAWPRKTHGFVEDASSPCIIEGGARCAWPRKTLSAKQGCHGDEILENSSEVLCSDGSEWQKDAEDGKFSFANSDGAAELPRRMLATSVGLSMMNQLTKGAFVTSIFDFCSSLPAGNLEFAEGEDAVLDVGRRTLLVFIKQSSG